MSFSCQASGKRTLHYAKGHSSQSDLFWRIHQNTALCFLLFYLCNLGVYNPNCLALRKRILSRVQWKANDLVNLVLRCRVAGSRAQERRLLWLLCCLYLKWRNFYLLSTGEISIYFLLPLRGRGICRGVVILLLPAYIRHKNHQPAKISTSTEHRD